MIDFNNASFFKLKETAMNEFADLLTPMFVGGEEIICSFKGIRDGVVFTNKRIIAINVQGLTGKKKDITSMPYNKIQTFSVETAGFFDLDSELEIYFSSVGKVKFEFLGSKSIQKICKTISEFALA